MSRAIALIIITAAILFISCESLENPFEDSENAIGVLSMTTGAGPLNDGTYVDSTGRRIGMRAALYLPKFITTAFAAICYGDDSCDTIFASLQNIPGDRDDFAVDTALLFHRSGTVIIRLCVITTNGTMHVDSLKLRLYCSPVRLSGLMLDGGAKLIPALDDTTLAYATTVPNHRTTLSIAPDVVNPYARIIIAGDTLSSDKPAWSCSLHVGTTVCTITTLADDAATRRDYTLSITRETGSLATLDSIVISHGVLKPRFDPETLTGYTIDVPFTTDSITLRIFPSQGGALISTGPGQSFTGKTTVTVPLATGENPLTTQVRAEDGLTEKKYALTVIRAAAPLAALSALNLSHGRLIPAFHPDSLHYLATVPYDDTMVTITPVTADTDARISIDGKDAPLTVAPMPTYDTISIAVTNVRNDTSRTYTLFIERIAPDNAALALLQPTSGALRPRFQPDIADYTLWVNDSVERIGFAAIPKHDASTVAINDVHPDSSFPLSPGERLPVTIVVTAGNGAAKKNYTVDITRMGKSFAELTGIEFSAGTPIPAFHGDTLAYELMIPSGCAGITIKSFVAHGGSTVNVNGSSVPPGAWSPGVSISPGISLPFAIVVISEDKTRRKSFHVTPNRAFVLAVGSDGNGITTPAGATDAFEGRTIDLTASASTGNRFDRWVVVSGEITVANDSDSTTVATVHSDGEIRAAFAPD